MCCSTHPACRATGKTSLKTNTPSPWSWPAARENTPWDWPGFTRSGTFIGIDLKGNRLYAGAKKCLAEGLANAAFMRTHIDKITDYFGKAEVQEIWITFPDPQLRTSKHKKRLTHPRFLRLYQQILAPGGFIHLKTDSPVLYRFTKRVIDMYGLQLLEDNDNIHAQGTLSAELAIKTHYEGLDIAQSNRIHYLKFIIPPQPLPDLDKQLHEQLKTVENAVEGGD